MALGLKTPSYRRVKSSELGWRVRHLVIHVDLSDECLSFIKINGHKQPFIIPTGQVFSGIWPQSKAFQGDCSWGWSKFIPRLGPRGGEDNGWVTGYPWMQTDGYTSYQIWSVNTGHWSSVAPN